MAAIMDTADMVAIVAKRDSKRVHSMIVHALFVYNDRLAFLTA